MYPWIWIDLTGIHDLVDVDWSPVGPTTVLLNHYHITIVNNCKISFPYFEGIWFGTRANLKKLNVVYLNLQLQSVIIKPSSAVRDLGVWLDSELAILDLISRTASTCFYHLRRLRQLRGIVSQATRQRFVQHSYCRHLTTATQCWSACHHLRWHRCSVFFTLQRPVLVSRSYHWKDDGATLAADRVQDHVQTMCQHVRCSVGPMPGLYPRRRYAFIITPLTEKA